jgi:hypothetical protein
VGPNSFYHLFLYQRLASIALIQGQHKEVEAHFKHCVEIAQKAKYKSNQAKEKSVFVW